MPRGAVPALAADETTSLSLACDRLLLGPLRLSIVHGKIMKMHVLHEKRKGRSAILRVRVPELVVTRALLRRMKRDRLRKLNVLVADREC